MYPCEFFGVKFFWDIFFLLLRETTTAPFVSMGVLLYVIFSVLVFCCEILVINNLFW